MIFQKEQQILKGENEKLKQARKKDEAQCSERVIRASGNFAVNDENGGNSSGLVEKLKEEICIQENKVVQLESELKEIKTSRRNQSFIPRPPGSSAGRKADNRRPLSGSR